MNELKLKNKPFYLSEKSINILRYLLGNAGRTQGDIIKTLNLSIRAVRYNLQKLLESGMIHKVPNLYDMRRVFYHISHEFLNIESIFGVN